jgi:hypothetical protein
LKQLAVLVAVFAVSAAAHQVARAQGAPGTSTFIQMIGVQCPTMVAKLVDGPIFKEALQSRELDRAQVCSCAGGRLRANPRLSPYLDATAQELRARLPGRQQTLVLMTYAMSAIIGCIVPQLDAALDAVPLE